MGRLFVFTLGFHENFAVRRMVSHSAGRGDSFVCFTLKPAAGATLDAYRSLRTFASRLGVEPGDLVELDCNDLAGSSTRVRGIVEGHGGPVVADLTGGPRCIILAVFLGLLVSGVDGEAWVQVEGGEGGEDRIPLKVVGALREGVSGVKREILRLAARTPGIRPEEVAEELGVALKTVQNNLTLLKKLGLVYQRGRGGGIYTTSWGRLLV